jgi:hypothetical protein
MRAESSPGARTGAFLAVAPALFRIPLDLFALDLAVPGIVGEFGVTPGRAPQAACAVPLRRGGVVICAASVVVMAVRHRLVLLGQVPPLGPRATRGGGPA